MGVGGVGVGVGVGVGLGGLGGARWGGKISAELDMLSGGTVVSDLCRAILTTFCSNRCDDSSASSHRGGFGLGPGDGKGAGEAHCASVERDGGYRMGFGNDSEGAEGKGKNRRQPQNRKN